jgi:hypothetical protein
MFVPALISLYTQPVAISVILFMAAIFSTLYHLSNECRHATSDEIWASLTVMVILVLGLRLTAELGFFHWRVLAIFSTGITAFVAYLTHGSREDTSVTTFKYELWHSIWHTLAAFAATLVVMKKSDIQFTNSNESLISWLQQTYEKSKENLSEWSITTPKIYSVTK